MAYPHGVYNSEVDTSLTSPIQGSAGLQVIFGTAPIHLTNGPRRGGQRPCAVLLLRGVPAGAGVLRRFQGIYPVPVDGRLFSGVQRGAHHPGKRAGPQQPRPHQGERGRGLLRFGRSGGIPGGLCAAGHARGPGRGEHPGAGHRLHSRPCQGRQCADHPPV